MKTVGLMVGSTTLSTLALTTACGTQDNKTVPTTASATTQTSTETSQSTPSSSGSGASLIPVPGTTVEVAADRLYSIDHIWVKTKGNDEATLGITDKIQALMEAVKSISLPKQGSNVARGDAFGFIEGYKMNLDLISPVSGVVGSINPEMNNIKETEYGPLNLDPYGKGWILSLKLSKTEELRDLLSADNYVALTAGNKTAT